ncbi:hypothetical protein [Helicobacter pylori]|uniref:hypothetical protein n=1 Tax=Helicobacter pylori TaxID=210 RepID=UPI0035A917C3
MYEKFLKTISAGVFLLCILGIFELVLIIDDLNKTEKLEAGIKKDLAVIKTIAELLIEHLESMGLEEPKTKQNKP